MYSKTSTSIITENYLDKIKKLRTAIDEDILKVIDSLLQ